MRTCDIIAIRKKALSSTLIAHVELANFPAPTGMSAYPGLTADECSKLPIILCSEYRNPLQLKSVISWGLQSEL